MEDISILENSGYTTLHQTVLANNLEATNALLSLGVNPDILDDHGFAPVHYAAMTDNVGIAKTLLANNADMWIHSEGCTNPVCAEAMRCIRLEKARG